MADKKKEPDEERREYEVSVKNYWDYNSTMRTAATNASSERAKRIALNMKADGMTVELIAKYTGLTAVEIEGL